jgi:putative SOS response-associated peptidase YedK
MCGRFTLTIGVDDLVRHYGLDPHRLPNPLPGPRYNIAPGQRVAVVRADTKSGSRRLDWAVWGWTAAWLAPSRRIINLRQETVLAKPGFRRALSRRCLVPADGFYEWQRIPGETARPYRVVAQDGSPLAFAGLCQQAADGTEEVAILTTAAPPALASIHPRVPLCVPPTAAKLWLQPDLPLPAVLGWLSAPPGPPPLRWYAVSTRVNRPAVDDPACAAPVDGGSALRAPPA